VTVSSPLIEIVPRGTKRSTTRRARIRASRHVDQRRFESTP